MEFEICSTVCKRTPSAAKTVMWCTLQLGWASDTYVYIHDKLYVLQLNFLDLASNNFGGQLLSSWGNLN